MKKNHLNREKGKECDLVMKGGITSGVIYPKLVARLSSAYTLRNLGGTSAGAIAAAAAAAAQLGVYAGTNLDAFKLLDELPKILSGPAKGRKGSVLFNLFQPQASLRRHFGVLAMTLNAPSDKQRVWRAATALVRWFPLSAVVGALPGVVLLFQTRNLGVLISLCVLVLGLFAGALLGALWSLGRALPGNSFGLCNGMGNADATALTPWLSNYFNDLAGKKNGEPLTFGELWAGTLRDVGSSAPLAGDDGPVIQLAMMTTALNLGRPYRLPFEHGDVYFVKEELATYFPSEVHEWLVTHARLSSTARKLSTSQRTFLALPESKDLPVIVAVRLSLSFPVLLSAIPLYAVDRSLKENQKEPTHATRVYFSDGGICSNFPVHFFDEPLPVRPTFAVNLRAFHPDHPTESVWLPEPLKDDLGLKNHYPQLPDKPGLRSVGAFLWSIIATMQSWRDQLQLAMPGFRDRIVHVNHSKSEGGLNLNMEKELINALADRGGAAAQKLIDAFAKGGGLKDANAWDNHQRIRVRTVLAVLQQLLDTVSSSLAGQQTPTYDEVVLNEEPPSYKFAGPMDARNAVNLLHTLEQLADELRKNQVDLTAKAPKPAPELRIVPRL